MNGAAETRPTCSSHLPRARRHVVRVRIVRARVLPSAVQAHAVLRLEEAQRAAAARRMLRRARDPRSLGGLDPDDVAGAAVGAVLRRRDRGDAREGDDGAAR